MRILIVKTSALGDILHAFPVLELLKQKIPHATIGWVVEKPFAELVEKNPLVDEVYCVETKKWRKSLFQSETRTAIASFKKEINKERFSLVFDLQGNCKSGLILSSIESEIKVGFGWSSVPEKINLLFTNKRYNPSVGKTIREDYLSLVQQYFGWKEQPIEGKILLEIETPHRWEFPDAYRVMVCPGSAWRNKKLPYEKLLQFLKKMSLERATHFYVLWGNQEEYEEARLLCEALKEGATLCEKMALSTLQHFMTKMNLVVSMDSLPLHLAASAGVATYSFFGPSLAKKYAPPGAMHQYYQGKCPYGKTFTKRCPALRTCKTGACLRGNRSRGLAD